MRRFQLRGVVRDYILESLHAKPDFSVDDHKNAIRVALEQDFVGSSWLPLLLFLMEVLFPVLVDLFVNDEQ